MNHSDKNKVVKAISTCYKKLLALCYVAFTVKPYLLNTKLVNLRRKCGDALLSGGNSEYGSLPCFSMLENDGNKSTLKLVGREEGARGLSQ